MTPPVDRSPRPRGREAQARRNDGVILDTALAVFSADPTAPMSAVARTARVGQATLYRRYPDKQALLVEVCRRGLSAIAEAAHRARTAPAAGQALWDFLEFYVESGTLRMSALLGSFDPPEELYVLARRANRDMALLVERAVAAGEVRADVTGADLTLIATLLGAVDAADPGRAGQLRRRYLALLWQGLTRSEADPLPGPAPTAGELEAPWQQHRH